MKTENLEFIGSIIDHAHDVFRIRLENGGNQIITAKLSGKMRLNKINLTPGDLVKIEVSPYDPSMGRITSRLRAAKDPGYVLEDNTPDAD